MKSFKLYKTSAMYFWFFMVFCLIYRFVVEGRNPENDFYEIIDFTINTSGYLSYIHTATFYTVFYVFIFGKMIIRTTNQKAIRMSREKIYYKNLRLSIICALVFVICFLLPHLLFMTTNYSNSSLIKIDFYKIMILQFIANLLYFIITSRIMLVIYYLSLNCIASQLAVIGINTILMFGYRLLKISSPIEFTLVCTRFYNGRQLNAITKELLMLIPITVIFMLAEKILIKGRDIL